MGKSQIPSPKPRTREIGIWDLGFGFWALLRRQQPGPRRAELDRLAGLVAPLEPRLRVVRLRVAAAPPRADGDRAIAADLDHLAVRARVTCIEEVVTLGQRDRQPRVVDEHLVV